MPRPAPTPDEETIYAWSPRTTAAHIELDWEIPLLGVSATQVTLRFSTPAYP